MANRPVLSKKPMTNAPARTIPKTTYVSPTEIPSPVVDTVPTGTTTEGYTVPVIDPADIPDIENDGTEDGEGSHGPDEGDEDTDDSTGGTETPAMETAPSATQAAVGPATQPPVSPYEVVAFTGSLGLSAGRDLPEGYPPLPEKEPDGIVLYPHEAIRVEGVKIGENVVRVTRPVFRRILPPGSKRWSHKLLYPAGHMLYGTKVTVVEIIEVTEPETQE